MTKPGARDALKGYDRQCRSCSKWSLIPIDSILTARCPHCGESYGRVAMGLDVPRYRPKDPKLVPATGQSAAADVPEPSPGEYGAE